MTVAHHMLSAIVRHWPFANGAGRVIDVYGKRFQLGTGIREAKTTDGFRMSVVADDLIGRHILLSGQFDRSIVRVLLDFAESGDQCLDVGANIGYVSCMMLNAIENSNVLAIEPQTEVFELLEQNLSQFAPQRWKAVNVGLSDKKSKGLLMVNKANLGASRIVEKEDDTTLSVTLLPASEVIGSLLKLDLMKVDVEGFEETIFRAGADVLKRLQPRAILFEDQLGKAGRAGSIGSLLSDIGYVVYAVEKRLLSTRLVPLNEADNPTANDYIAISRTRSLPKKAVNRHKVLA